MKGMRIISVVIIITFLTSCYHEGKMTNIQEESIFTNENIINSSKYEKLLSIINLCENEDGGYGYLIEEANMSMDIYTTYFMLETKKILNNDNLTKLDKSLFDSYQKEVKQSLVDIYFYSLLFKENFENNDTLDKNIINFVKGLKTETGYYAYDINHKKEIDEKCRNKEEINVEALLLPTFMSISVLNIANEDYDKKKIEEQTTTSLEKVMNSNILIIEKMEKIKTLLDIYKLLDYKINEIYINEISLLKSRYENELLAQINNEELYLHNISTYIDICKKLNWNIKIPRKTIADYILKKQSDEGGFAINIQEYPDALSIYLAVNMLYEFNDINLINQNIHDFM